MRSIVQKKFAHRQLQVTGNDTGLLVVPSGVSSQLQDLSGEILEHNGQINQISGTDVLGIPAFVKKPVDTTDGEQSRPGGASLGLSVGLSTGFTSSAHYSSTLLLYYATTVTINFHSVGMTFK